MIGKTFRGASGASFAAVRGLACALLLLLAIGAPPLALAGQPIVSGRVTDHLTGAPIAGLQVSIYYNTSPFTTQEIGAPVTDADGRYTWAGPCPTSFPLHCYVSAYTDGYLYATRSFDASDADIILDIALIRAAKVSGTFTIDGAIADHEIGAVIEFFNEDSGRWSSPAPITYEEADGHYAIGRLPFDHDYRVCAGGVEVDVVRQCWNDHEQTALSGDPASDTLRFDEGEQRDGINFDFRSGGAIKGTLHDGYLGTPFANRPINVRIYDGAGVWVDGAARTTDAEGRYRVAGLPDGTYYVSVVAVDDVFSDTHQIYPGVICTDDCAPLADGTPIAIASGATIGAIDFTFHPDVVVEGRVTDAASGAALAGIHVFEYLDYDPTAITAADGTYRFYETHRVGTVRVHTRDSQPLIDQVYPATPCLLGDCIAQSQGLAATTGAVYRGIDFALELGSSITGYLTDVTTGGPLAGYVSLYDASFNLVWYGDPDENGFYASGAWFPGTYYAKVFAFTESAMICAFYDARPCPAEGVNPGTVTPTPIALSPGEVRNGIDFTLSGEVIFASGFDF
jgi:hypothetical protein